MVQRSKASLSWVFARKGFSPKNGRGLLQLRVYLNRKKQKYISTREHFTEEDWKLIEAALIDSKKEKFLSKDLITKLQIIKSFRHKIESYETSLIYQDKSLTFELLESFLRKDRAQTFNEFIQEQLDADLSLKGSTKRTHQNTINKLTEFKAQIDFGKVNYSLIEGFDNFLRKKELNLNSIQGHHKRLSKYMAVALHKEMIDKNPYNNFTVRGQEVDRTFLLMEEVEKIETTDFSEFPMINRIKDLFLFGCYTGLRFSDLMNLALNISKRLQKALLSGLSSRRSTRRSICRFTACSMERRYLFLKNTEKRHREAVTQYSSP